MCRGCNLALGRWTWLVFSQGPAAFPQIQNLVRSPPVLGFQPHLTCRCFLQLPVLFSRRSFPFATYSLIRSFACRTDHPRSTRPIPKIDHTRHILLIRTRYLHFCHPSSAQAAQLSSVQGSIRSTEVNYCRRAILPGTIHGTVQHQRATAV